jgi:hypothetical protein
MPPKQPKGPQATEKAGKTVTKPEGPTTPADEVVTGFINMMDATIDDVRALGIDEDEISDDEIIDALQRAVTAGMSAEGAEQ